MGRGVALCSKLGFRPPIPGPGQGPDGDAMSTEPVPGDEATRPDHAPANGGDELRFPELLAAMQAMQNGDFSVRLPGHFTGISGKIADTFNDLVAANGSIAQELERVGKVVGSEGKTRQRAHFRRSNGAWGGMETSINALIDDLVRPTT